MVRVPAQFRMVVFDRMSNGDDSPLPCSCFENNFVQSFYYIGFWNSEIPVHEVVYCATL